MTETNSNNWQDVWEPERDWALRKFDDADRYGRLRTQAAVGAFSSGPFQLAATADAQRFADAAEALRARVRGLLMERTLPDPDQLASFLLNLLEERALAALSNLATAYRALGADNVMMVQKPVDVRSAAVRATATSVRVGLAEDVRAELRRRAATDATATATGHDRPRRRRVLTLHGIKTRGTWQKDISAPLGEADFIVVPLDYGHFWALQLLLPWSRRKKIAWFFDQYCAARRTGEPPPDLIAHSFGTYIAAEAMRKFPEVCFESIVLCGAIVERHYPWDLLQQRRQCVRLWNEVGGRDWIVKLAEWTIRDAGASGTGAGFDSTTSGLTQNPNIHFHHSDALYPARVERLWIPFLQGKSIHPDPVVPGPRTNTRFLRFTAGVLSMGLLALAAVWIWSSQSDTIAPNVAPMSAAKEYTSTNTAPPQILLPAESPSTPSSGSSLPTRDASSKAAEAEADASSHPISPKATSGKLPSSSKMITHLEITRSEVPPPTLAPSSLVAPSLTTALPNRSAEDTLFLSNAKRYGATSGALREAVHWLSTARHVPLTCSSYQAFLRNFETTASPQSHRWFRMTGTEIVSREDAIRETAYYAALQSTECQQVLQSESRNSGALHVLLQMQNLPDTLPLAERRRHHAKDLLLRIDGLSKIIRGLNWLQIDASQYDEYNYLIFMADSLLTDQPDIVPKPLEVPHISPHWKEKLQAHLTNWRGLVAAFAIAPCAHCSDEISSPHAESNR